MNIAIKLAEKGVASSFPNPSVGCVIVECDKKSYTVIKNGKKEIKVRPEKYKGVCFDNQPHYLYFPKKGLRAVMVFTFKV